MSIPVCAAVSPTKGEMGLKNGGAVTSIPCSTTDYLGIVVYSVMKVNDKTPVIAKK